MLPNSRDLSQQLKELDHEVRSVQRVRLDQYLHRTLGWSSRTKIQQLIRAGYVQVNDLPAKNAMKIGSGDALRIVLPTGNDDSHLDRLDMPAPFWEDSYLLAVNKPAGWLVHPVGKTHFGTVINELHARYRPLNTRGQRAVVPKLCHRLDRYTSGVLLVSKTDEARRKLSEAFAEDRVNKEYIAIVEGYPARLIFEIDLPISPEFNPHVHSGNRLARVADHGKPAQTMVRLLGAGMGYSVLLCMPKTGRQNQIRAHLAEVGLPILGDVGYGSCREKWEQTGAFKQNKILYPMRPLLHSASLEFEHPVWGVKQQLTAPPPQDYHTFLHYAHEIDPSEGKTEGSLESEQG